MTTRSVGRLLTLLVFTACLPQAESEGVQVPEVLPDVGEDATVSCGEGEHEFELDYLGDTIVVPISEGLWIVELKLLVRGCTVQPLPSEAKERVREAFIGKEDLALMLAFAANRTDPAFRKQVVTVVEETLPGATVQALKVDIGTIEDHNIAGIPDRVPEGS